jgi:hypothetical protein
MWEEGPTVYIYNYSRASDLTNSSTAGAQHIVDVTMAHLLLQVTLFTYFILFIIIIVRRIEDTEEHTLKKFPLKCSTFSA